MKTAWLECATGISGDMTLAALIDVGVDTTVIREAIDSLQLPDVRLRTETVIKNGFRATQVLVEHPEQHAHRHYSDICEILERSSLSDSQRQIAQRLFLAVAESEARVHGSTVEKVHFHEVGAVDSIVDIVGAAVGFDLLAADRIVCNRIPTGRGFVHIDHGICPIPAPGTAEILKGIPLADVPIDAELTTPTGAAIVRSLADDFGPLPPMTIDAVGYGAGTMTFPQRANILRLFVGQTIANPDVEYVTLLETNIDDVSGELVGHLRERLMNAGALDVWLIPIQMKKDRPGTQVNVLCRPQAAAKLEETLFAESGTLGIRRTSIERRVQHREAITVTTPWGPVEGKRAWRTGSDSSFTPEFESCANIAREHGVPLRTVYQAATAAWASTSEQPVHNDPHSHGHDAHSHDHDGHSHDHDGHTHDHDG